MIPTLKHVSFVAAIILAGSFRLPAQECPGNHCSKKSEKVNEVCKKQGKEGEPVWVEHEGDYCYCVCSCLASNTLVAVGDTEWKEIGGFVVGDHVLALSASGAWESKPVVFSNGSTAPTEPYPYAIYVVLKGGPALVSTSDHLYLTMDGLKRADRLGPQDRILDKDRKPLEIESLTSGAYFGSFHNIVATEFPEDPAVVETSGHLLNTAGVISGDYFLQLYYEGEQSGLAATPQVGSAEFEKAYPGRAAALKSGLKDVIDFGDGVRFVPATKFEPPKGACSFLPRGKDIPKSGTQARLDDSISLAMARHLRSHFRAFYPDVEYHIDDVWNDNTVNAYAWQDSNDRKHVALLGGLLRHHAIKLEGAGLVLSHELGHHYGGLPRYPNHPWPSSCEGQADYWGALVAMRQVWFGGEAMRQIREGASQLYDLFANGLVTNLLLEGAESGAAGLCSHPAAQCRLDTYLAAMRLDDKPSCAGDPPGLLRDGGPRSK